MSKGKVCFSSIALLKGVLDPNTRWCMHFLLFFTSEVGILPNSALLYQLSLANYLKKQMVNLRNILTDGSYIPMMARLC